MAENMILLDVNNKDTNQPAHPRSLISIIAICSVEKTISKLTTCKISRFYLVSLAELASLEIPKTGFLGTGPICS